jgi:thiol-disulfide isomerase/thioredoxin
MPLIQAVKRALFHAPVMDHLQPPPLFPTRSSSKINYDQKTTITMNAKIQLPLATLILLISIIGCGSPTPYPTYEPMPTEISTDELLPTDTPIEEPLPTVDWILDIPVAPVVNNRAPDFTLSDTEGNSYNLWKLRGQSILINFWATWCVPCESEMPSIQSLSTKYPNLIILAIDADGETYIDIDNYKQEHALSFPLLIDEARNTPVAYNVNGYPTSFFLDGNGIVRYIQSGAMSEQQFEEILNSTIFSQNENPSQGGNPWTLKIPGTVWSFDISESHHYDYHILSDKSLSNFILQSDVVINNDAHEYHGVFFRQQDGNNFYSYRITPDGFFAFDVWRSGDYSFDRTLGPTLSGAIYTGVGQTNTLKVVANNDNFEFYINGEYVGSVTDGRFSSGKVGVISCTCDGSPSTSASFSNFYVDEQP